MKINHTPNYTDWQQASFDSLSFELKGAVLRREEDWAAGLDWITIEPPFCHQVHPGIWVGSCESATQGKFLEDNNIKTIVNFYVGYPYEVAEDITQHQFFLSDGKMPFCGIYPKVAEVIHEARQQGHGVLVHCQAGVSRSSTGVLTYLMLHEGIGWEDGVAQLKAARPMVCPHPLLMRGVIRDLGDKFLLKTKK